MRFVLIFLFLVIGGGYFFAEYKADEIARSVIEAKVTEITKRPVLIQSMKIDFLKERVTFNNITVKNNDGFPGSLLEVKKLIIMTDLQSLAKETVVIKEVILSGSKFQYKVEVRDGRIIDNLDLINQALSSGKTDISKTGILGSGKQFPQKKIDKNFLIKKLLINNTDAHVVSNNLKINAIVKLNDMEFRNVGNSKNANHFKDVGALILTNIVSKVKNEVLRKTALKKFNDKINSILNKEIIGNSKNKDIKNDEEKSILDGLLKSNKEDILKKFDKLLKER